MTSRMQAHRREGTSVIELDPGAVGQVDQGACVFVGLSIRFPEDPVSIHPEMDVKNGSVIEMEQLVLAPSFDTYDPSLLKLACLRSWKLALE